MCNSFTSGINEIKYIFFFIFLPGWGNSSCPEGGRLPEPDGFVCSVMLCLAGGGGGGGGSEGGELSNASSPAFRKDLLDEQNFIKYPRMV